MDESIIPRIGKTGKLIGIYIDSELREAGFDLTVKQWVLLKLLSHEDGRIQNDLAIITERNKASLARLLTTVERKGFIKRQIAGHDARAKYVFLTKKGDKLYRQTLPTIENAFARMQAGIPLKKIEMALDLMECIQQNIKQQLFTSKEI